LEVESEARSRSRSESAGAELGRVLVAPAASDTEILGQDFSADEGRHRDDLRGTAESVKNKAGEEEKAAARLLRLLRRVTVVTAVTAVSINLLRA